MLRRLIQYARPHRARYRMATACSVLNRVFDLAPPVLIGLAVDIVVKRENSLLGEWGVQDPFDQIKVLAGLTLFIWVMESIWQYAASVLWRGLAQTIQHELRLDTYAHVQRLQLAYFEDQSTGGLMSILNDDINQLERFLDSGANEIIQVITTVVVIGAIFFALAPSVAILAMLPMPFILLGSFYFTKRIGPRYKAVRDQVGLLSGQLSNNLSGIATIKSYTAEQHEVDRIRSLSDVYLQRNRHAIRLSSAFSPLIRIVVLAGFTGTLILGGKLAIDGQLGVGEYSIMVFMTQRLLWPLTRLGDTFDLYQRAMASTGRALDLLDTPPQIKGGTKRLARVDGAIAIDKVEFSYASRGRVLHGIDLAFDAGRTTAVVGPTGSGKTTIIKLLLRFYDPQGGVVRLDGTDLRELELPFLRDAIGLVSQDTFLFHGTVRENIAYGTFDAPLEAIVAAAKAAEAHEFIEELPEGYETIVGERGQKLSGGQRQRISIARAILKDPPVLVLDEATSSVDNETEAAIQRSLARVSVGRTTIVIAHRLSTIRHADTIYVMDRGRVSESGTHEELLDHRGVYATLWDVQTGEHQSDFGTEEAVG
ncbi:MAG: ABC transporter ATP-binding protein [Planctomycetota bacterium]|jgi:ATP-binding cassette subfamily B protein